MNPNPGFESELLLLSIIMNFFVSYNASIMDLSHIATVSKYKPMIFFLPTVNNNLYYFTEVPLGQFFPDLSCIPHVGDQHLVSPSPPFVGPSISSPAMEDDGVEDGGVVTIVLDDDAPMNGSGDEENHNDYDEDGDSSSTKHNFGIKRLEDRCERVLHSKWERKPYQARKNNEKSINVSLNGLLSKKKYQCRYICLARRNTKDKMCKHVKNDLTRNDGECCIKLLIFIIYPYPIFCPLQIPESFLQHCVGESDCR